MSTDDQRRKLLTRLLGPVGPEITCEECFELLDEYVELELAAADADRRLPGLSEHLHGCPACSEDHESLRDFVQLERCATEHRRDQISLSGVGSDRTRSAPSARWSRHRSKTRM